MQSSPANEELSNITKHQKCVFVKCPLAGQGDPRCNNCTGPIVWTDERGVRHGKSRACTSCRMNGLGLPVCWAGCCGPNEEFSTDGQKIVTLGGMKDMDAYIKQNRVHDETRISADEKTVTHNSRERGFVSAILKLDAHGWEAFREICKSKNQKEAARVLGVPLGFFRGEGGTWQGSVAERVMDKLIALDGREWEIVKWQAAGKTQQSIASLVLVSKQAINKRIKCLVRREKWVADVVNKK